MSNEENQEQKKISKERVAELEAKEKELETLKSSNSDEETDLKIDPVPAPQVDPEPKTVEDEYECAVCHKTFSGKLEACPSCGVEMDYD